MRRSNSEIMAKPPKSNTLIIQPANEREAKPFIALHDGTKYLWRLQLKGTAPGQLNFWDILIKKKKSLPPDQILVVTGPGSFSGTRAAVNIANGLGYAWNVPVAGIRNDEFRKKDVAEMINKIMGTEAFIISERALPAYNRKPY